MRDVYTEFIEDCLDKYLLILQKKQATRKIYPKDYDKYFRKLVEWDRTFIERFHVVFPEEIRRMENEK